MEEMVTKEAVQSIKKFLSLKVNTSDFEEQISKTLERLKKI